MQLDLPPKIQIDNGRIARRINNEGRIIGSRVRHVSWLHTYCKRAVITPQQYNSGYHLGYLWNTSTIRLGPRTVRFVQVGGGAKIDETTLALLSTELREALKCIRNHKMREAVIDLCVFDMAMGPTKLARVRLGLDVLTEYFKQCRRR